MLQLQSQSVAEIPSEPRRNGERRKLSEALRLGQPRSYAVQPVHLSSAAHVTDSKTPNRFFTPFELSNGFEPSKTIPPETLKKIDEEDTLGSDQQPQQINRIRSTTESVNETEIPAIIRKDLGLEKRKDGDDKVGAETPDE
ncbi:unnamed protein product [Cylicostephanus goldi]|uniref:Uncharacterized protein n=1 Tax=Cylicostephanus goldi TaxID=71465 RepID=A0A3P7QLJ4_CYLGO|nr:unnamed protein product [Cylicostephanus goldi]